MNPIKTIFTIIVASSVIHAQQQIKPSITLESVFPLIETDRCDEAYSMSIEALNSSEIQNNDKNKFRWCALISLAQMFINEKISYEELKAKTKEFPLGPISLPGYKAVNRTALNFISTEGPDSSSLFIGESNQNGTYMFSMTRIKLLKGQKIQADGKTNYYITGQLKSLEYHPYGRGSYVFRAFIDQGFVESE